MSDLTKSTSRIPYQFFDVATPSEYQRYLIDRSMLRTMTDARVINWVPSMRKLYPIRTSGLFGGHRVRVMIDSLF